MSQVTAPDVRPFRIGPIRPIGPIGPILPPSNAAVARDFHASKMLTPSTGPLPKIITKPAWYRGFLFCTAKPKFSFSHPFAPFWLTSENPNLCCLDLSFPPSSIQRRDFFGSDTTALRD